jgi:hypothetical protein
LIISADPSEADDTEALRHARVALRDMRSVRRGARTKDIDAFDALYHAYIIGLAGFAAVLVLSSWVGDADISSGDLNWVDNHGAALLGVVFALLIAMGVRSGARGGPLAIEAADVQHVLLAPVDRADAMRGPALRQLRHSAAIGAVVGGIAGELAARRLPGDGVEWTACGAAAFGLAVVAAYGAGYLASGNRLRRRYANLIALFFVAWAALELGDVIPVPSPTSLLGRVALWPLSFDALGVIGMVAALVVAALGLSCVGGVSLEAAERRSTLIGRLAFAATLQDLRTVIVLRRQLAQEHPRRRPWLASGPGLHRFPVWARGWRGVMRWPLVRVARLVVFGAAAGAAAVGIGAGTTPLLVVAGFAAHLAALDALEAMAQEVDHPSRTDAFPFTRGSILVRHIPIALVVMGVVSLIGFGTAVALAPTTTTLLVGAVTVVSTTFGAVAGAAISTVAGPPDGVSSWAIAAPEAAGVQLVVRLLWPPFLAVLGVLPVLVAERVPAAGATAVQRLSVAAPVGAASLAVSIGVIAWVHAREPVLERIRASFSSLGSTS